QAEQLRPPRLAALLEPVGHRQPGQRVTGVLVQRGREPLLQIGHVRRPLVTAARGVPSGTSGRSCWSARAPSARTRGPALRGPPAAPSPPPCAVPRAAAGPDRRA